MRRTTSRRHWPSPHALEPWSAERSSISARHRGRKSVELGQRLHGHALHLAQRLPEVAHLANLGDRGAHGLRTPCGRGGHVRRHDVPRGAGRHVRAQHFIDRLVLAEMDLAVVDGDEQRAEDLQRGRVVPGEDRIRALPQVVVHLGRVGEADARGRLGVSAGRPPSITSSHGPDTG